MNDLVNWNKIKNYTIHPGQTLTVKQPTSTAKPATKAPAGTTPVTHKVSYGESLWLSGSKYGVSVDELRKQNGLKGDLIHPGQVLVVKRGTPISDAKPAGKSGTSYTVKAGDSVWLIANRYGVSMDDLVKWNKIKNNTIHPGQVLTIQSIVSTPEKPTITTTPKVEAKPAITTTPKVKEQPAITTVPKTESEVLIEKANGSKKEYKYSHSVIEKAKLDPLYHNFPKRLDGGILSKPLVIRTDGRIEHLVKGAINGEKGVYHITVKGDNIIHRAFIPESDWARFSKVNELLGLGEIPSLK